MGRASSRKSSHRPTGKYSDYLEARESSSGDAATMNAGWVAGGWTNGKLSGYAVLAGAFGVPMAASLIGAVLDRIYESILRRKGE